MTKEKLISASPTFAPLKDENNIVQMDIDFNKKKDTSGLPTPVSLNNDIKFNKQLNQKNKNKIMVVDNSTVPLNPISYQNTPDEEGRTFLPQLEIFKGDY